MKRSKFLKDTEGKIEWWGNELSYWTELLEVGEFTARHIDRETGEVIEKGIGFDVEQFTLAEKKKADCIEHLEYYREVLKCIELLKRTGIK